MDPKERPAPVRDPGSNLPASFDPAPPMSGQRGGLQWQIFAVAFMALFLELMVIRWVPSVVRLVAYYANLMLLSSFAGLGLGAMMSSWKRSLLGWFPLLLAADIGALLLCRHMVLGMHGAEERFFAVAPQFTHYLILIGLFAANAAVFLPLGQKLGALFNALPQLTAYTWDLSGSLCGTLCFGLFSLRYFSPVLGMALVALIFLALTPWRRWAWSLPCFAFVVAGMVNAADRGAVWSPYYHITVRDMATWAPVTAPPADLRTRSNPPIYVVNVNQDFYQVNGSQDPARYTPGSPADLFRERQCQQYQVPYLLGGARRRVLVVGAGGGADVQAALRSGAEHVDAVEIDPVLIRVSRRFNADAPYDDPRVQVHIDDARSYFSKARSGYDLVVFGFLDSQALFSSMSNIRLDGYVYTVESLRSAFALLKDDGLLALSFSAGPDWLLFKLRKMVAEATGRPPLIYVSGAQIIICVSRGELRDPPPVMGAFRRLANMATPPIAVPTDDWPFLYLSRRTIPGDYLVVISSLLALSLAAVFALRRGAIRGPGAAHFGLLGMGFMLLETKSIGDCSLYFGATWLVTLIVVTGVLLMVLAANLVARRLRGFSPALYVPLFLALALLYLVPREEILSLGMAGRLGWTLLAVPLPVFFAGLIFSTTFRDTKNPAALFGINLCGAMVGGFCEYLGMAFGSHVLSLLVIVAYAGSFGLLAWERKAGGPAGRARREAI